MPEVRLIDANSLKHSRGIAGDEILHEIIDNQPTINPCGTDIGYLQEMNSTNIVIVPNADMIPEKTG